jgi:hypothetical protein
MATTINIQKQKRADSTLYSIIVLTKAKEAAIQVSIDQQHGLPSNIEENIDDSNVEQPHKTELKDSTLF